MRLEVRPAGHEPVALGWGDQVDTRPITSGPAGTTRPATCTPRWSPPTWPSTSPSPPRTSASTATARSTAHRRPLPRCRRTPCGSSRPPSSSPPPAATDYERLADRYGTLGYRGHVLTKTRRYSTTFGALRQARQTGAANAGRRATAPTPTPPAADDDHDGDEADIVVERNWRYAGSGYLDADEPLSALTAAALARSR